ncbi:diguanylate cyclase [Sphingomicrobium sp. XHP0235]|uniref:GGDEF domain-containing protein n=1 Tax=Sphingomicrobium aquimarinum TaxID=3133971 RepID=UPI0031FEE236
MPVIHNAEREMMRAMIMRAQGSFAINLAVMGMASLLLLVVDYWPMLLIALVARLASIGIVYHRGRRLLRDVEGEGDYAVALKDWSNTLVFAGVSWSLLLWCVPANEIATLASQALFSIALIGVASVINTIVGTRRALWSFIAPFLASAVGYFLFVSPTLGFLPLLAALLGFLMVVLFAVHVERQQQHIGSVFADNAMLAHSLSRANVELSEALAIADRLAHYDQLTGLRNRRSFEVEARRIQRARDALSAYHLLLLDVDCFKSVNDRFGHAFGDRVLEHIGKTLDTVASEYEDITTARLGGEEFAIIVGSEGDADVALMSNDLRRMLRNLAGVGKKDVEVTVSIGATRWRADETVHTAMLRADRLLYDAKDAGRDRLIDDFEDKRKVA